MPIEKVVKILPRLPQDIPFYVQRVKDKDKKAERYKIGNIKDIMDCIRDAIEHNKYFKDLGITISYKN